MIEKLEQTICFAAVCEAGTMTAASEILGCSKGHVSRTITALEQRIKAKLFHRSTRKLTLTDAGLAFEQQALQLYRNAQLVEKRSMGLKQQLAGQFVITAPVSLATYLLAPVIPDLQLAFPEVEFEIIPTNESLNLISEGVDLAIRTGSVVDDNLIAHQIGVAQDVFYAHENLWSEGTEPQTPEDLNEYKVLINQHSMHGEVVRLSNGEVITDWQPHNKTVISLYTLLLDLVERGAGIGFAPNYCLPIITKGRQIKHILPAWHGKEWPVFLVYPFHLPTPEKLAQISGYLKTKLRSNFLTQDEQNS